MERLEIPVNGESEPWLDALERGDEVVFVRDGKPAAELTALRARKRGPIDLEVLAAARAAMAPIRVHDAAALIRGLRDAADH
ncbi:hypothetical protein PX554_10930 [Sphingomonas sp. H39-1-10]|uniref:hypothetical protein n=1 Tax=Sphingomonas TaxID=13687 RepID=UPI00088D940D|nr:MULTISPECIES: hypothetical protein [Sphingomonas]MDF0488645.1 hypothetical protein [Sphingomonas pollutisoli]SDA12502.1 hypothetical protein SAMN03159340_00284 [Sphingomonas sp. NFR15]